MNHQFVIGLDFGTDSVRAVLVNCADGSTVKSAVHYYQRWKEGAFCNPAINQFRQHPLDHIEGMEATIRSVVIDSAVNPLDIRGICIDTTGSSPIAVDKDGKALSLHDKFAENPNAMVVLWKDHTSVDEAEEINQLSRKWDAGDYTDFVGGIYSSEWFWAKILHVIREDEEVKEAAYSWMEHCDYMTYLLIGEPGLDQLKRSRCAAGHKAMWHKKWDGLPDEDYLSALDPYLGSLRQRLYKDTYTSDLPAGHLSEEWAKKLGLTSEVVVAVGTFDAHAGAVGAEISEKALVRVMGTSTCDIIVAPQTMGDQQVRGICGQVDGSVLPGMIGLEAGQSAFGDVLAWFRDVLSWPLDQLKDDLKPEKIEALKSDMIRKLSEEASALEPRESYPIALDWINGRRTPDANQLLKSAMVNLSLGTRAPHIFKALVEAICFGSRKIVERFRSEGVEIETVVGIGGVAKKSRLVMQTLADVLNMPIKVSNSDQAPALGAAMYAAVAAGVYPDMSGAIAKMGSGFETTYQPNAHRVPIYDAIFEKYVALGDFVEQNINTK